MGNGFEPASFFDVLSSDLLPVGAKIDPGEVVDFAPNKDPCSDFWLFPPKRVADPLFFDPLTLEKGLAVEVPVALPNNEGPVVPDAGAAEVVAVLPNKVVACEVFPPFSLLLP